jgi:hypothetical protein
MPNDCYNYLEAPDGDVSLIADYFSTRKRDYSSLPDIYLNFAKIIPYPDKKCRTDDWRNGNWGTKWNSYDGNVTEDGISFNTAWSPPTHVIVALAKQIGKSLRLIYDEPNMDFCGELSVDAKGLHCNKVYSPRSEAPDYLRDDLMINEEEELDEDFK